MEYKTYICCFRLAKKLLGELYTIYSNTISRHLPLSGQTSLKILDCLSNGVLRLLENEFWWVILVAVPCVK